jgi:hypothetical protein
MKKRTTSVCISLVFFSLLLFFSCQDIPPTASKLFYVSADQPTGAQRLTTDCAVRYTTTNKYGKMDDNGQREAIRAGFDLWQKVNPNLGFLELPQRATLFITFVDPAVIPNQTTTATVGLVRGSTTVAGGLRKEANGTYTILLSNTFDWDKKTLTRAIAYHAGLLLGMPTSVETSSLMSTLFADQPLKATRADSVGVNKLFTTTCKDLTVCYLPLSLTVGGPVTKTIKFDKQGTVSIKASGQMIVGGLVGTSTPIGRECGVLCFSLESYSIVPTMNHAALMYKLNNEAQWRYCGSECSFPTGGLPYADLLLNINDKYLSDDVGGYDVVVDYK